MRHLLKENPVLKVEIWKEVEEFPEYKVSNTGKVISKSGKVLKTFVTNSGYEAVTLYSAAKGSRKTVHRLVAKAFVVNPEPGKLDVVNHKDGNRNNNDADNLEWTTQAGNIAHAIAEGLTVYNFPTRGKKLKSRSEDAKPSKYLGVMWDKPRQKWKAQVTYLKKVMLQKRFDDELEAAKCRDSFIKEHNLPLPLNFN